MIHRFAVHKVRVFDPLNYFCLVQITIYSDVYGGYSPLKLITIINYSQLVASASHDYCDSTWCRDDLTIPNHYSNHYLNMWPY